MPAMRLLQEKLNPAVKHGFFISGWTKHPPWPFNKIHDAKNRDTGVMGLCAPFIKYFYNVRTDPGSNCSVFKRLASQDLSMICLRDAVRVGKGSVLAHEGRWTHHDWHIFL